MNFKEVEEEIKQYYSRIRALEQLNNQLEVLNDRKDQLEYKIEHSNITLFNEFSEISGVSYDGVGGSGGSITSPQERAIDKAFVGLEKKLEEVKVEILLLEEKINDIQVENSKLNFIIKNLDYEYKAIIEGFYKNKSNAVKLSLALNMDRATIYRKRDKVLADVTKWVKNYF